MVMWRSAVSKKLPCQQNIGCRVIRLVSIMKLYLQYNKYDQVYGLGIYTQCKYF